MDMNTYIKINKINTVIEEIEEDDAFFCVRVDNIYMQCCRNQRKDGKGYKKEIKATDNGYNWGMCEQANEKSFEKFGDEETLKIMLKCARKFGYKIIY